ncbi:lipid A biosynthesis lauroyl acyltransferase [Azospirillum sp. sgz301742]
MAKPRSPLVKWLTRHVAYPLEAALVWLCSTLFRALPVDRASDLGGWVGRALGPRLPSTRTARRNLTRAFPERTADEIEAIIVAMWDNLGRVIAEYPHLDALADSGPGGRTEIVGLDRLESLRDDGVGGIAVGGHLGNWEVPPAVSRKLGLEVAVVYRAPNNPMVARMLTDLRGAASSMHVPKGPDGAIKLARILTRGGHAGMLVDQKLNTGIAVPFFGRDAMTAPAAMQLGLRLRIPIVPLRTERLEGARFRITLLPPLEPPATGDRDADVRILMERMNALLEAWIRERPEQWLWVHKRWPD